MQSMTTSPRATSSIGLAITVLAMALAGCDSCNDKPKGPSEAGASSSSASSAGDAAPPASTPSGVMAAPGCRARTTGGAALAGKLEPGNITIAVVSGKALVVNTVFKDPRKLDSTDPDAAIETAKSERVVLAANGLPDGPFEPVIEPHGADEGTATPLTWAVATTFKNELSTMSYGTGRSGTTCAGGTLMTKGAGSPLYLLPDKHCRFASALAGAGRGDLAVALLDGPAQFPIPAPADGGPSTVKTWPAIAEAVVWSGGKATTIALDSESHPGQIARIEAPAVAVGKSHVAVAYRVVRPGNRELHVTILDPSGKKVGKTEVIEKGDVGAPTIAFEDDALHVVWASRSADKEAYALRWTKLTGTGAVPPPQRLSTGIGSAFAPGLAIDETGRFLLAWMEGDDKRGVVKVGLSRRGIAAAVAHAAPISNPTANARDPEVGLDKTTQFVVWQEYTATTQELRAASLECRD